MSVDALLSRSEYYAPFPIFNLTDGGIVLDVNLAGRALFSSVPSIDIAKLLALSPDQIHCSHDCQPEEAAATTKSICCFLPEFGKIELDVTILHLPSLDSPECFDKVVYAQIGTIQNQEIYHERLRVSREQNLRWETYASSYDNVLLSLDFYNDVLSRHIDTLSVNGIEQVMDIGAGTGNVSIPLLRSGRSVTAVDTSRAMLDKMRSKLSQLDGGKVNIFQQDAQDMSSFSDSSFDGVSVLLSFFDMSDPAAALAEAIRILRPRGLLVITEPKRNFDLPRLLHQAEAYLRENNIYEKLRPHWKRVSSINRKIDPMKRATRLYIEDIRDILVSRSFDIIEMRDSHHGNCATIKAQKATGG